MAADGDSGVCLGGINMARILSVTTNSSPKIGYTVDVSQISRTPTQCKVRYTVRGWVASSAGWLYTGHAINVTIHGVARQLKSSSARWTAGKGNTITVDVTFNAAATTATVSGVTFSAVNTYGSAGDLSARKCSSYSITRPTASFGSVSISGGATDQSKAKVTVSGLPNVGYATSIRWYLGGTLITTTNRAASTGTSSYSHTFTGLLPNTSYTAKAVVYGVSTVMSTKTLSFVTPQETGELSVTPRSTYITAKISNMFSTPNYEREIDVYFKRSTDEEYTLFSTVNEQSDSLVVNITDLISNVKYDIKTVVRNNATVLKEMIKSTTTIQDTSLVPTPGIESVTQKLGTRNCIIYWLTDKAVAGTIYKIQAKAEGESDWTILKELSGISSPIVVASHAGNKNVLFRISASNEAVAASTVNYSNEYTFYVRDDFVWDSPKTKGQPMIITASEWNRLREYAISRNKDEGRNVDIPVVRTGDPITANAYNIMKNVISLVNNVGVSDKSRGDAINAADVDALRIAINKTT